MGHRNAKILDGGLRALASEKLVTEIKPFAPVQFDGKPGDLTPAPEHGAHTELVLLEMGFSWDDIAGLKEAGVVN